MGSESPAAVLFDMSGNELPVQNGAAIPASTPMILVGGSDGANSRYFSVDTSGNIVSVGAGTAGTPVGGVVSIQGVSGGQTVPISGTVASTGVADVTATGTLGALNATVQIALAGTNYVSFEVPLVSASLTVTPQVSFNGGTVWFATRFKDGSTGTLLSTATWSGITANSNLTIIVPGGASHARVIVTAYTSGAITANLRASTALSTFLLSEQSPGFSLPPTMVQMGGSVTTSSPAYSNATLNALSLTTAGALRIDGSATTQPVSGTVTANQGTPNTTVNSWPTTITDGTNGPAAVKAASTAAAVTDPALVVVVSPNNSVSTQPIPDTTPATINITTQDVGSITSNGANNQLIITGSATAGSTASFALSSWESAQIQVTGTWTGALQVESSPDGGTTWYPRPVHQTAAGLPETLAFNSNFLGSANVSGFTNIRVRSVTAWTGTATVKIVESLNGALVYTVTASPVGIEPAIEQADAFHRLRVSQPVRQWSSMSEYPDFPYLWETAVAGTGTVAWQQFLSSQRLSTGGTGSTASAIRQTRRYMRYQPGKSSLVNMTFVMSAPKTNAVAEIGYYDASNGLFFQRSGTAFNIVRRTNVTGTPTDNIVAQINWNLDRLDGTGPSGVTLDVTKAQVLIIDYQWLGVGTARVGFEFGGVVGIIWAHQFVNQNSLSNVYMSTGCLPLRGRVANTGTAGGTVTMDMICTAYSNEGGPQSRGVLDTDRVSTFSIGNGATLRTVTNAGIPILSLRAATQYGGTGSGGQRNFGWIVPVQAAIYSSTVDVYWEIWAGITLTGASWTAVNTTSIADYDVSATAVASYTNGFRVVNGYTSSSKSGNSGAQFITPYEIPLVYSGLNNIQDTITVVIFSLTTGSNTAGATALWEERY